MFAGKFVKWERFLAVLREQYFSLSSELRFVNWVRFFDWNCIGRYVIFCASFLLILRLSPRKSEIKKKISENYVQSGEKCAGNL